MPIYEFYCNKCHRIFNFFSSTVNTEKRPACPKCGKKNLDRRVSRFAALKKGLGTSEDSEPDMSEIDEGRLERAMATLAGEAERLDENDPKQAVNLMRKLTDMTGISLGDGMEEALNRLEAGEDPDQIEAELGDALSGDDMLLPGGKKAGRTVKRDEPPAHDDELYIL